MRACPEPAAGSVIAGEFAEGDTALVDFADGEFVFGKKEPPRQREPEKWGAKG
jgi:hypothetical protein